MAVIDPIKKTDGIAKACTANHRNVKTGYVLAFEAILQENVFSPTITIALKTVDKARLEETKASILKEYPHVTCKIKYGMLFYHVINHTGSTGLLRYHQVRP